VAIGQYKELLKSKGFQSFLWTESLGALNDNLYKIVVTLAALAASAGTDTRYLSMAQAVFILPFLLFSGYAGYLADKYSKRTVLVWTKAFEIVAMGLALAIFLLFPRIELMLGVLFLMALQSTFFGPAKYGILPEMLPDRDLSRANGLLNMTTFLAIILGTAAGGFLYSAWRGQPWAIGLVLVAVAAAGFFASLGIPRVKQSGSQQRFDLNPWAEVAQGVRRLQGDRRLWLTVMGICYFWFLGALLQITVLVFGKQMLGADELRLSILVTCLAVGIGAGSMAAGRLSGDKVELGLVPLGAIGMGVFAVLLAWSAPSYPLAAAAMALLGFSGGLFVIPLNAFLQQRSGEDERGRIFAATNFLTMAAVLLASFLSWILLDIVHTPVDRILWMAGIFTLLSTVYVLEVLPEFLIRFILWLFTHTVYRIRIVGQEHVPFRGPALLVCNHLSAIDGFLVGACVQRFIRFMVYKPYYEHKLFHRVFRLMNAIPVGEGRKDVVQSLERAREELRQGHVVCIFPEGSISRTGNLLPFKRGMERIARDLEVPIIPVHLDGVWGSIFSFEGGRFFKKLPRHWPYPVTVSFGEPLPSSTTAQEARQAVMELSAAAVEHRRKPDDLLHLRFIRMAKRQPFYFCMADSGGHNLTYVKALAGSLALSRWVKSRCSGESMIGLLLPSSVGGALANIAVTMTGKVPVNLNFTAGLEAMEAAVEQCGVRTILTSRVFVKKAQLPQLEGMVFLEDVLRQISAGEKISSFLAALLLPSRVLQLLYCGRNIGRNSLATVIFSSGSTGVPKGVMLSHHNVISNIEGISQLFAVNPADRVMGVLPFFHSFGFTGTLWFPLLSGFAAAYHPNPLDAKTVGEMVAKHRATLLISTPTFYSAYLRKCSKEHFASLRLALVGAEKLRAPLAEAFQEKYGLPLVEGYGATETAPVISANCPDFIAPGHRQVGTKSGSVGHPLPGIAVKVVDLDTGAALPMGQEGLLLVKGPNVMLGYLGQAEKTAEVLQNGWYTTGDIGRIDEDGFIHITDRLSRFSKIGGEMVPHIRIEQVFAEILTTGTCAVTAVPDERKGEQLVLFHTSQETCAEELWKKFSATDLPKLWIPKRETLLFIEEIPILGTGKTDLKKLRTMALERLSAPQFVEAVTPVG
jgi:acyl-[acyl-carrier-protein]-phospholipid O-acyltransferase/long-chain-fatty-acid--[acyl-carrier-protein] ligase